MNCEESAVDYAEILATCELGIVLFKTLFMLSLVVECCDGKGKKVKLSLQQAMEAHSVVRR
jgi:hypothetical protein